MSGFFGVASKKRLRTGTFYGVDYHSHLGTRRGGMAVYGEHGFDRAIHNIENTPFRTKFDGDVGSMKGNMGIGCISDYEPQPLLFSSRIGSFALTFVGKINNYDELLRRMYDTTKVHFQEMTNGTVNVTELIALICEKGQFCGGYPVCPGSDRRLHDVASHDKRRNLCGPGQDGQNSGGDWPQRGVLLSVL